MSESDEKKADRKNSAAAAADKSEYEDTPFGRRRISRLPKVLTVSVRVIAIPFVFVYRRVRRSRSRPPMAERN